MSGGGAGAGGAGCWALALAATSNRRPFAAKEARRPDARKKLRFMANTVAMWGKTAWRSASVPLVA
jgi:hypothetical protein